MTSAGTPAERERLLIVGVNYAPEPTGSAPYTAGLAETLAASGHPVDVVTGVPHYPSWRVDPAYRWCLRRREHRNGVQVHRLRHYVPGRQSALTRIGWEASFLANAGLLRTTAPAAVIASMPSLGGGVYAASVAQRHGSPLAVVVQDLVGQATTQSGLRGGSRVSGLASGIERRVLLQADLVAVVSPAFRDQLSAYGVPADRIVDFPNWTHIGGTSASRTDTRRELGWGEGQFVVLHTGNMGLKQDLGNVVEAARLHGDGDLGHPSPLFVLMGNGNQRSQLERQAAGLANVAIVDGVDAATYPAVLAAADLLLVNERASVGDMSLPSKLTSYLAAGRPVLAAVGNAGACAGFLAGTAGAARLVPPGEPRLLLDAVLELRDDEAARHRMSGRAADYASQHLGLAAAQQRIAELAERLLHCRGGVPAQAGSPERVSAAGTSRR
ncbi:MAG: glycosyltransferase [Actinomycetota bacterium]|nr:glycosyltransferase [Actinomycetota bacterium]